MTGGDKEVLTNGQDLFIYIYAPVEQATFPLNQASYKSNKYHYPIKLHV